MYRYKLIIEYDGTKFYGFQAQKDLISVQGVLEKAISNLSLTPVQIWGAGRTDRGVHATGQVIHFDLSRNLSNEKIKLAINFFLKPFTLSICQAENLGENSNFHARFSAKARHYQYKILQQSYKPTFNSHMYLWINKPLDHNAMHLAAQNLIGTHDFTSFRSKACSAKSPLKTIHSITVNKVNNIIVIEVIAPSFLHHQVRFIVGALIKIGLKKWNTNQLINVLLAKDNTKNSSLAPPHGLYLTKVVY